MLQCSLRTVGDRQMYSAVSKEIMDISYIHTHIYIYHLISYISCMILAKKASTYKSVTESFFHDLSD